MVKEKKGTWSERKATRTKKSKINEMRGKMYSKEKYYRIK